MTALMSVQLEMSACCLDEVHDRVSEASE